MSVDHSIDYSAPGVGKGAKARRRLRMEEINEKSMNVVKSKKPKPEHRRNRKPQREEQEPMKVTALGITRKIVLLTLQMDSFTDIYKRLDQEGYGVASKVLVSGVRSRKRRIRRERLDPAPRSDRLTLLDAFADPRLFAKFFPDPESWISWTALIASAFGLPMTDQQLAIYRQCTGRTTVPTEQVRELVLVVGRRGGKSRVLALIATWLSAFVDYKPYLDPGERGVVQLMAADRDQSKIILRYIKAFFKVPMLAKMVERETQFGVELSNNVAIEVTTASFRSVRGRTTVAVICDEIAFFNDEGANPDAEIIKAVRPSMATVPNAMLILASSPYARKGVLWDMHRQHHGKDDPKVLSWQASTETMNPSIDPQYLADQYERDPVSAQAEYGAQFRTDVEAFIAPEAIRHSLRNGFTVYFALFPATNSFCHRHQRIEICL